MLTNAVRKSIATTQIVLESDNGDIGAPPDMPDSSNDYTGQSMAQVPPPIPVPLLPSPTPPLVQAMQSSGGTNRAAVIVPPPPPFPGFSKPLYAAGANRSAPPSPPPPVPPPAAVEGSGTQWGTELSPNACSTGSRDFETAPSQPLPFARQQSSGTFSTAVPFPVPTLEVESRPRGAELSPPPSFTDFRDLEDSAPSTTRPPRPPGVAPSGQQKYTILRHKACL